MEDLQPLYDSIKLHEGFRSRPYPDPIHGWKVPTVGYGSTHIDESVAERQMQIDVGQKMTDLSKSVPYFVLLPLEVRFVLIEMAYQLGVGGVMKFERMWEALKSRDYEEAANEMLDSKWAQQTPERAHALALRMRSEDS